MIEVRPECCCCCCCWCCWCACSSSSCCFSNKTLLLLLLLCPLLPAAVTTTLSGLDTEEEEEEEEPGVAAGGDFSLLQKNPEIYWILKLCKIPVRRTGRRVVLVPGQGELVLLKLLVMMLFFQIVFLVLRPLDVRQADAVLRKLK